MPVPLPPPIQSTSPIMNKSSYKCNIIKKNTLTSQIKKEISFSNVITPIVEEKKSKSVKASINKIIKI